MTEDRAEAAVTLRLLKRDMEDLKESVSVVAALQRQMTDKQQVQSVACASTCATIQVTLSELKRRQDVLDNAVNENRKRLNQVFGLNTVITAVASVFAAVFGE